MVNAFKWRIQGNTYAYWTDINDTGFIITDQYDIADESKISDIVSRVENESVYEERYNEMAAEVKAQFNMDMLSYTYYFNMSGDYCGVGDDRLAYKGVGIYEIEAEQGVVDGVTGTTVTIYLDDSARTSTSFFVADGKDADVDGINEEIAELNGKVSTNTDSIIYLSGITDSLSGQIQSIINWQEGANSVISTSVGDINQWTAMTQSLSGYVYSDLQQEIGIMDDGIAGVNQKITQLSGNTTAVTQSINQQISTANSEISRVEKLSYVDGIVGGTPVTAVTNTLEANYSQVQQQADRIETTVSNFKIGNENLVRRTSNSTKGWVFEDDAWTLRFHRENGLYEDYKDALSGTTDRIYIADEYFNDSDPSIKCGVRGLRINVRNEDSAHTLNPPLPLGIEQYPIGQDGSQIITGGIDQYPETRYIDFTQELYSEDLLSSTMVVTPFLKSSTDYVLSFYARADASQEGYIYTFITGADNEGGIIKTLEYKRNGTLVNTESSALTDNAHGWDLHWNSENQDKYHRYTYSFTTGANTSTQSKLIFRIPRGTIYSIGQVQLEEGNTVSTWGESSMDVDKKFSKIEQTDENISLTVADTLYSSGFDIFSGSIKVSSPKFEIAAETNIIDGGSVTVYDENDNISAVISSGDIATMDVLDIDDSRQTISKAKLSYKGNHTIDSQIISDKQIKLTENNEDYCEIKLGTLANGEKIKITVDKVNVDGSVIMEDYYTDKDGSQIPYKYVQDLMKENISPSLNVHFELAEQTGSYTITCNSGNLASDETRFYYDDGTLSIRKQPIGTIVPYGRKYTSSSYQEIEATRDIGNATLRVSYTVNNNSGGNQFNGLIYYQTSISLKIEGNAKAVTVIGHNGFYSYSRDNSSFYFGDNAIMFRQGNTGLLFSGTTDSVANEIPGGRLGVLTHDINDNLRWLPFYNYTPLIPIDVMDYMARSTASTPNDRVIFDIDPKYVCGGINTIENKYFSQNKSIEFDLPNTGSDYFSYIPIGYTFSILYSCSSAVTNEKIYIRLSDNSEYGDNYDVMYYKGKKYLPSTPASTISSGSGTIKVTLVNKFITYDNHKRGTWLLDVQKNDAENNS